MLTYYKLQNCKGVWKFDAINDENFFTSYFIAYSIWNLMTINKDKISYKLRKYLHKCYESALTTYNINRKGK